MEELLNRKKRFFRITLVFLRKRVLLFYLLYLLFTGQVSKEYVYRIIIVLSTILIMNLFVSPVWFCIAGGMALEITRLFQYYAIPKNKRKVEYSVGVQMLFFFGTLYFSALIGIVYFDNVNVPYNKALLLQTGASAPTIIKSLTDNIPRVSTFKQ
jgi:hypothetical protein